MFVRLELTEKTLNLAKHEDNNDNLHDPDKRKMEIPCFVQSKPKFWIVWRYPGIPCSLFFFYFGPTIRKVTWKETTTATINKIFSKGLFLQFLDHSNVQSSSSAYRRQIDKIIFKETLQLTILRTGHSFERFLCGWGLKD